MARLSWLPFALFLLIVFASAFQTSYAGKEGSVRLEDCPKACDYRCSHTHRKQRCVFFCNYCCKKCLCVPSGFYGHKEECPCYKNILTKKGKQKCP